MNPGISSKPSVPPRTRPGAPEGAQGAAPGRRCRCGRGHRKVIMVLNPNNRPACAPEPADIDQDVEDAVQ